MSLIIDDIPGHEDIQLSHLWGTDGFFRPCGVSLSSRTAELDLTDMHIYHLVHYWMESVDIANPKDTRLKLVKEIMESTIEPGWSTGNKRIQLGGNGDHRDMEDRKTKVRKKKTRYQIAKESKP